LSAPCLFGPTKGAAVLGSQPRHRRCHSGKKVAAVAVLDLVAAHSEKSSPKLGLLERRPP
jgi:hypothetical protein